MYIKSSQDGAAICSFRGATLFELSYWKQLYFIENVITLVAFAGVINRRDLVAIFRKKEILNQVSCLKTQAHSTANHLSQ